MATKWSAPNTFIRYRASASGVTSGCSEDSTGLATRAVTSPHHTSRLRPLLDVAARRASSSVS